MSAPPPLSKKETLLRFLSRGIAMVHLDARREGTQVPVQYLGEAHLRLNLSYRYAIHDLEIDDQRVQATLSFGGVPFRCIMPWNCIFGITSHTTGDGQVWPEDLPTEVMQSLHSREETEHQEEKAETARPQLAAVQLEPAPAGLDAGHSARPQGPPAKAKPPPHLRLVR